MASDPLKPGDTVTVDGVSAVIVAVLGVNALCKMPNGEVHLVSLESIKTPTAKV